MEAAPTALFNPGHAASASVRTLMHCELESLAFADLRQLMKISPGLAKEIKQSARKNFLDIHGKVKNANEAALKAVNDKNSTAGWLAKKYKKDKEKFNLINKLLETSKEGGGSLNALRASSQKEEQRKARARKAAAQVQPDEPSGYR